MSDHHHVAPVSQVVLDPSLVQGSAALHAVKKGLRERDLGQREVGMSSFFPGIVGGGGRDGRRSLVETASEFL